MKQGVMSIKTFVPEAYEYYKYPVLLIASPFCNFKCCTEAGVSPSICQNSEWAQKSTYEISNCVLIDGYLNNPISKAIVFAGLEPLDSFEEVFAFIEDLRIAYQSNDLVIIYTGYQKSEKRAEVKALQKFPNIIVKFGRYIPNAPFRYDEVLGVTLASDNQYAEKIS